MGRKYDREFKIEALKLASEPGNRQSLIERKLGIGQGIISRWKKELSKDGESAFPGKGHLKPEDEELRALNQNRSLLLTLYTFLGNINKTSPDCRTTEISLKSFFGHPENTN